MIAIVDYARGNTASVRNAFKAIGQDSVLTKDPKVIAEASAIVLPGVGAFGDGMKKLQDLGLDDVLTREVMEKGTPFLGICLGLQLIAKESEEFGNHKGLGWIDGCVRRIQPASSEFKVPHMGWNTVDITEHGCNGLFSGVSPEEAVYYFVHSYCLQVEDFAQEGVSAWVDHGMKMVAAYEKGNICAVQFHPEKSQKVGLSVLERFVSKIGGQNA